MQDPDERSALRARIAALEAELATARESADVLTGVLAAVPAIVMRVDATYSMRDISRVVSGFTYEEVRDTPFLDYMPEADRPRIRAICDHVLETGEHASYQTTAPGPDGTTATYDSYVARTVDRHGVHALVVVAIDVTERLVRERAFVASEESGRLAVEATGVGLWSMDVATGKVTWNDAMHRICGVPTPLTPAEYTAQLVHPDDNARASVNRGELLSADRFQDRAMRIVRPDGELRWVVNSGRVLRDDRGAPTQVIGTTLDVTTERMMDERLRQTQRLEAVGQLAAGVAHNFNNILASIVPVLDLVAPHVPARHRTVVEGASHSAGRATELVRQLMTFAGQRAGVSRRSELLSALVERAMRLCRHLIDPTITLSIEDAGGGTIVRCDPGAIEQAIVNLVLNARDAIEETERGNGTICVVIGHDTDARQATVRVIDDGVGMSSSVVQRIFEPFFTTKDVGRGTGLGLPVTYATVRDHGGSIRCTSEVAVGSVLEMILPIDEAPMDVASDARDSGRVLSTRKILLVDDDDGVRASMGVLLTELGQTLLVARTASDALARAEQEPDVALVLLDRAMPGQSGDAIIPALRAVLPASPIVYFTGEDVDDHARAAVDAVLQKPATRDEILGLLTDLDRSAIDRAAKAS